MSNNNKWITIPERLVFGNRISVLLFFLIITSLMVFMAAQLQVKAGFKKQLPLNHEYMQTFLDHEKDFGGANRLLVALMAKDGEIFDANYFKALEAITKDVSYIPGVNQSSTSSIFTPDVRFIEIVEGGFAGGNVIPADFAPSSSNFNPTVEDFEQIKSNIVKAGVVGRLVAENFDGAMVWADLIEEDPVTGEPLNYKSVADQLEMIRDKYTNEEHTVHIIGFAKIVGDISEGAASVVSFFGIAILFTAILLYFYSGCFRLSLLPLICSLVAVAWQLGALHLLGFGIDPMNILTPFLIFAIGVSHGVQMVSTWNEKVVFGEINTNEYLPLAAAKHTFRRLLVPGSIALLSDTIGFLTIMLIDIDIIQELAIAASIGVAVIILTNLILLPILLSYIHLKDLDDYRNRLAAKLKRGERAWKKLAAFTKPKPAAVTILIGIVLCVFGLWKGSDLRVGDSQTGVPELHEDSRYNLDAKLISEKFSLGVDQISVIAETVPNACTENYQVMAAIDDFAWVLANVPGVQKVITLPKIAKIVNAGWNEGSPKWRVLSRNNYIMRQNLQTVETDSGLLNHDCSAMPIIVFTEDHRAETINRVVATVEVYQQENQYDDVTFRLATGNVGVMAATNQVVKAAQAPILFYVYGAIILLCLITFRSFTATICIVMPLALVSVLAYALMVYLGIGLKVNTLPVVALGVGIGVDYGIYIFSRLREKFAGETSLTEAYLIAIRQTGKAVLFTGLTLAIGVSTWWFSALKFQADMGILLTFMFVLNMIGAVVLLPALACFLYKKTLKK